MPGSKRRWHTSKADEVNLKKFRRYCERESLNSCGARKPLSTVNAATSVSFITSYECRNVCLQRMGSFYDQNLIVWRDIEGKTALMYAVASDRQEFVEYLIERRADINAVDYNGMSAMHHAAKLGADGTLRMLLNDYYDPKQDLIWQRNKAVQNPSVLLSIDARDEKNWNPLMYAAHHGHLNIVRELLRPWPERKPPTYGRKLPGYCDITSATCSECHLSAIELAVIGKKKDIVKFMVEKCIHEWEGAEGPGGPPSLRNVWSPEIARHLIRMKADVCERDYYGSTLLEAAIMPDVSNFQMIQFLVEETKIGLEGSLIAAAWTSDFRKETIVRYLIHARANVNETNEEKDTPLIVASRKLHTRTMKTLLRAGAEADKENKKGENALSVILRPFFKWGIHRISTEDDVLARSNAAEALCILLRANPMFDLDQTHCDYSLRFQLRIFTQIPKYLRILKVVRTNRIREILDEPFQGNPSLSKIVEGYDNYLFWHNRLSELFESYC